MNPIYGRMIITVISVNSAGTETLAQSLASFPSAFPSDQDVVYPLTRPFAPPLSHIVIVTGSLCPEGAVIKLGGKELPQWRGRAQVFDEEAHAFGAIMDGTIQAGDALVCVWARGGPSVPLTFLHCRAAIRSLLPSLPSYCITCTC